MTEKNVLAEVKYPFSRTELLELGERLARATDEVAAIEQGKKQMMAEITSDLKKANGKVFALAAKLKDRFEYREMPCIAVYGSPRAGMKTILRADTREEDHTEPMTESEMQECLDFGTTAEGPAQTPTQ